MSTFCLSPLLHFFFSAPFVFFVLFVLFFISISIICILLSDLFLYFRFLLVLPSISNFIRLLCFGNCYCFVILFLLILLFFSSKLFVFCIVFLFLFSVFYGFMMFLLINFFVRQSFVKFIFWFTFSSLYISSYSLYFLKQIDIYTYIYTYIYMYIYISIYICVFLFICLSALHLYPTSLSIIFVC